MNKPNIDQTAAALVFLIALMIVLCGVVDARARQEGYRQGAIKTCIDNTANGCNVNGLKAKFYNEDNPNDNQETRS